MAEAAKAQAEPLAEKVEKGLSCPTCKNYIVGAPEFDEDSGVWLCPECGADITEVWEATQAEKARAEMEAHSEVALPSGDEGEPGAESKSKPKRKRKAKAQEAEKEPVAVT